MNQLPCPESKIIESTANITKTIHTIQSEPVAKSANFIYILLLTFHFLNSINLKLSFSCTYNFSSKWLHHLKNDSIRVSEIKSSAFPKSICPKVEILRFRQALHMIFDKGFVNRINVIRVKAYF